MSLTKTPICDFGKKAETFELKSVDGNIVSLDSIKGENGTLVMFICNHCPYVKAVIDDIIKDCNTLRSIGVSSVAICSNDVINYPDDDPIKMKALALEKKFPFYYLYDETQEVAKSYDAACTPDFSVFNDGLKCVYRGQMDDSRPGNEEPSNGKDLREVLDYILSDKKIDFEQKPSLGCNIKWK